MKVKIDFTIEVDAEVVRTYMDELQTDETMKQFLVTWCSAAGSATLDESIHNALGEYHMTNVVRQDY
jgi:hypothetical protein